MQLCFFLWVFSFLSFFGYSLLFFLLNCVYKRIGFLEKVKVQVPCSVVEAWICDTAVLSLGNVDYFSIARHGFLGRYLTWSVWGQSTTIVRISLFVCICSQLHVQSKIRIMLWAVKIAQKLRKRVDKHAVQNSSSRCYKVLVCCEIGDYKV